MKGEEDIVFDRKPWKEAGLLENHPHRERMLAVTYTAFKYYPALCLLFKTGQYPEQCCFA